MQRTAHRLPGLQQLTLAAHGHAADRHLPGIQVQLAHARSLDRHRVLQQVDSRTWTALRLTLLRALVCCGLWIQAAMAQAAWHSLHNLQLAKLATNTRRPAHSSTKQAHLHVAAQQVSVKVNIQFDAGVCHLCLFGIGLQPGKEFRSLEPGAGGAADSGGLQLVT